MICLPILKWAGGKRSVIPLIDERIKHLSKSRSFFDVFGGGASVALYFSGKFTRVVLNDINEELINVYLQVKHNPDVLIKHLEDLKIKNSKEFFYKIRELDRFSNGLDDDVFKAARTIYLNKTCYNGLYRVNSKGQFNVPYGRYKNPKIFDKENIISMSRILNDNIDLSNKSYEFILDAAKKGDVVYFDPPYDQENGDFAGYTKKSFTRKNQEELRIIFDRLTAKGVFCVLSNSATSFIKELYKEYLDDNSIIYVKRTVGAKISSRAKVEEILISNFEKLGVKDG